MYVVLASQTKGAWPESRSPRNAFPIDRASQLHMHLSILHH